MVSMRYDDKVVPDFEQLVKLLPPDAVASPLRSTVPLVDFWRTPESRLAQLSATIGVAMLPPTDLCFEFPAETRGLSDFSHGTPVPCHHRIDSQQSHALNRCLRDKNPVEGILVKGRQAVDGEGMFAGDG